jgi:hypothetical protein
MTEGLESLCLVQKRRGDGDGDGDGNGNGNPPPRLTWIFYTCARILIIKESHASTVGLVYTVATARPSTGQAHPHLPPNLLW